MTKGSNGLGAWWVWEYRIEHSLSGTDGSWVSEGYFAGNTHADVPGTTALFAAPVA